MTNKHQNIDEDYKKKESVRVSELTKDILKKFEGESLIFGVNTVFFLLGAFKEILENEIKSLDDEEKEVLRETFKESCTHKFNNVLEVSDE